MSQRLTCSVARIAAGSAMLLALGACGGDTTAPPAPVPTAVLVMSGNTQVADAGSVFLDPIVVKVTDAKGAPTKGVSVTFEVAAGPATISPTTATTDAQGLAQTRVTALATPGDVSITVRAAGVTQTASAALTVRSLYAKFAGDWDGTTSQNLPVYFRVTPSGTIDSLTLRVSGNLGIGTCTSTLSTKTVQLDGTGKFQAPLSISFLWSTKILGEFTSTTAASGTFDPLQMQAVIICGSTVLFGSSSGSSLPGGSWTAKKR